MTAEEKRAIRAARARKHYHENVEKSREYSRKWRENNIEKARALNREYARKRLLIPENRVNHCLKQARRRAVKNGIEFSISLVDLLPIPTVCPIFMIPINYSGTGRRGFVNNSPSIDRINSTLGYVPGNVEIISWRANRIKSDATTEELRSILNHLERKVR